MLSPASRPTSTKTTGDAGGGVETAAASPRGRPHRQSGVVRASSSVVPRTTSEEPRKCRRGRFILSAGRLGKRLRDNPGTFFGGEDLVDGHVGQLLQLATRPGDFERFDFGAPAQAKENSWIVGRHVAHAALGLLDVHESLGG